MWLSLIIFAHARGGLKQKLMLDHRHSGITNFSMARIHPIVSQRITPRRRSNQSKRAHRPTSATSTLRQEPLWDAKFVFDPSRTIAKVLRSTATGLAHAIAL
jgi:hypothetical protein